MTVLNLRPIVEGLLFAAAGPLSLERLCGLLEEHPRDEIRSALEELLAEYREAGRGILLQEVAGGYQFRTRPELADYLRRFKRGKVVKFSGSALETLAIVAYRQPITRVEVEYLRGVDCGAVLKTLLDRRLVRILGKKDVPGKPILYGTTREFLETFSLKDLASLPSLKEIQDLVGVGFAAEQAELPLGLDRADDEGEGRDEDSNPGGE
jgi:segregation and condensation protein B